MSMFKVCTTTEQFDEVLERIKEIDANYCRKDWFDLEYVTGMPLYVYNDVREQKDNACWYYLKKLEKAGLLTLIED